jgi:hypothetical protein
MGERFVSHQPALFQPGRQVNLVLLRVVQGDLVPTGDLDQGGRMTSA